MKIRLSQLKQLIREVAISPSVFQNAKRVEDPMSRSAVAKAVQDLENGFRSAIENNLVLDEKDAYNPETRELDDDAYARAKEVAQKSTEMMVARVHKAIQGSWAEATKGTGSVPARKKAA